MAQILLYKLLSPLLVIPGHMQVSNSGVCRLFLRPLLVWAWGEVMSGNLGVALAGAHLPISIAAAPQGAGSLTCAWADVDGILPWTAAASVWLLPGGVGGDGWENPGTPVIKAG